MILEGLQIDSFAGLAGVELEFGPGLNVAVSYTHLTLPTIYSV